MLHCTPDGYTKMLKTKRTLVTLTRTIAYRVANNQCCLNQFYYAYLKLLGFNSTIAPILSDIPTIFVNSNEKYLMLLVCQMFKHKVCDMGRLFETNQELRSSFIILLQEINNLRFRSWLFWNATSNNQSRHNLYFKKEAKHWMRSRKYPIWLSNVVYDIVENEEMFYMSNCYDYV